MRPVTDTRVAQAHRVDIHVGTRVRGRRKALGMSQIQLAHHLGLTFQQVQKYERGTNRISASKLFEIAQLLQVSVAYFFDAYTQDNEPALEPADDEAKLTAFMQSKEGRELALAFLGIPRAKQRRQLLELMQTMGSAPS